MTGLPVIVAIESAAPPRASPSSLVRTTPSYPTPSRKAWAVRDGVLADHRVDDEQHLVGLDRVADVGGLLHHLGVDAEPAGGVDDDDVVQLALAPRRCDARATATGSPTPLPGSGAKTGTPARSPLTCELVDGVGPLQVGRDEQRGLALLLEPAARAWPASVVLPAPWRPASMITVGGSWRTAAGGSRRRGSPTSSSLTILTTCWAGFSAWLTSSPRARSLTAATKSLTTGSATSASSSAIRISRAVASMSASESRPLPRRFLKVVGEAVGECGEQVGPRQSYVGRVVAGRSQD